MQERTTTTMVEAIHDDQRNEAAAALSPRLPQHQLKKPRPNNPRPPRPEPVPPPSSCDASPSKRDPASDSGRQQHRPAPPCSTARQQRQRTSSIDRQSNRPSPSRSTARRRLSFYLCIMKSKLRWLFCIPATSTAHGSAPA